MSELTNGFQNVLNMITLSRENALRRVNEELIMLYWNVGEFISKEIKTSKWGDSYIDELAKYITNENPTLKGFSRRGLYRMKQFYELYNGIEFVSTLLTQISWSNHLAIMSAAKTDEEREFYIKLCIKEKYSTRELKRQLDSGYYERYMLSKEKLKPIEVAKNIKGEFLDSYVLEFLDLPVKFTEFEFKKAIISNLKNFILEIGKDFIYWRRI